MPLRPTIPRIYFLALTLTAALLTSGCTTESPLPSPTTTPEAPPIFASEEEALAAAEEAYGEYVKVVDEILAEHGVSPRHLSEHATPSLYELEKVAFDRSRKAGTYTTGQTKFDSMRVQRFASEVLIHGEQITVYVCDDYSDVDVLNSKGESVVRPDRLERVPMDVGFVFEGDDLKVARIDVWQGENFC